jgi:hypothetical protein
MANASDYAQWIVNNPDKKGTPEFETVVQAYQAAKTKEPKAEKFSVGETIKNIPSSAVEYGKNIVGAVLSPVQTIKGALDVGSGAMVNAIPGYEQFLLKTGADTPEELARVKGIASGVGQYYKERFANPLQTLQQDPVGMLGDVSGVLTGGATVLPKIGGGVAKIGAAAEPLNLATNVAGYGIAKALPATAPAALYESAAKWLPSIPQKQRAELTQTALREQLMPTSAGVGQAYLRKNELGNTIDSLIQQADATGVKVPSKAIFAYIDEAKSKLGGPRIEAAADLAEINKIERNFKTYLNKNKYTSLTPNQLQDFKQNIYDKVDYGTKKQTGNMAQEEVYKGMGRAAKEAIQGQVKGIEELNRQQGALINLLPNLERAASRIENRDLLSIGSPIKAGAGQAIGGPVGGAVGSLLSLFEMPKVKSKAALELYKKQNQGINMFLDNNARNALLRQLLEEQGAYGQYGLLGEQ